jgi:Peptidase family C25
MNQALIRALFGSQPMALGEATATAKTAVSDLDVRQTWILFGDPATKLQ